MKNNTMENSASNPSIIQALQSQAAQLLPLITCAISSRQYDEIAHQRISQQNNGSETDYQGLTRANHSQFGRVMIKWQLSADAYPIAFDLTHEVDVLAAINALSRIEDNAIAPPLLAHHCVNVQILEQPQKLVIVVMPYYLNGSLARQLSGRKYLSLIASQKHHFINQSAYLIANLHHAGWLHNDIKPSNILLDGLLPNSADNSSVMPDLLLTDFALAQRFNAISVANPAGTPAYLAPERWQGKGATVQSDIYAFGVMMVEILAGRRPFQVSVNSNDKLKAWAIQHCQQPIPKLSSEYSRYQCMVDKALAKRVEKRYRSMEEVLEGLERL